MGPGQLFSPASRTKGEKQVLCDGVLLLSSALIAIKYLGTNTESMRMSIYVNHFSNFCFPGMDLLIFMLLESKYKTVFKSTKCALEVLFIAFANCKQSEIPPFRLQSQFQRKMMPCASRNRTTSLFSELEYNHIPLSQSTVQARLKVVLLSVHYKPWAQ